jgi:hypothetical protein
MLCCGLVVADTGAQTKVQPSAPKMKADFSETLVPVYQTTRCHIPVNQSLDQETHFFLSTSNEQCEILYTL